MMHPNCKYELVSYNTIHFIHNCTITEMDLFWHYQHIYTSSFDILKVSPMERQCDELSFWYDRQRFIMQIHPLQFYEWVWIKCNTNLPSSRRICASNSAVACGSLLLLWRLWPSNFDFSIPLKDRDILILKHLSLQHSRHMFVYVFNDLSLLRHMMGKDSITHIIAWEKNG